MTTGPFVDKVIYHVYTDQATAVLALAKGDLDFIHNPNGLTKGFVDQLKTATGVKIVTNPSNGWYYLSFNLRKAPGSYLAYRQAVAYLIDKDFV
ncbi:MAG: ABC transporter substrate-binding protein, partial [Nitrospiraceae bacterium]|nr:ABC transporter substrate-binding protein [Nitrospiraceae bacterium]